MSTKRDDIRAAEKRVRAGTNSYTIARECLVQIDSATNSIHFISSRTYLLSGYRAVSLESEVKPGANGSALFVKTPYSLRGSVGVLTYDLSLYGSLTTEKMAVMFFVPFNFNFYENWFAVGVFSSKIKCDDELYHEMYYNNSSCFVRGKAKDGTLTYQHEDFVIEASMSDTYNAILNVKVKEKVEAWVELVKWKVKNRHFVIDQ
uniref:Uncharacterized protein n=1 Tax=Gadus morhua TaxID=8049 RepID=A0A8C5D176_GADMO